MSLGGLRTSLPSIAPICSQWMKNLQSEMGHATLGLTAKAFWPLSIYFFCSSWKNWAWKATIGRELYRRQRPFNSQGREENVGSSSLYFITCYTTCNNMSPRDHGEAASRYPKLEQTHIWVPPPLSIISQLEKETDYLISP